MFVARRSLLSVQWQFDSMHGKKADFIDCMALPFKLAMQSTDLFNFQYNLR